jgi:uncharacterized membrane protein SirB2
MTSSQFVKVSFRKVQKIFVFWTGIAMRLFSDFIPGTASIEWMTMKFGVGY